MSNSPVSIHQNVVARIPVTTEIELEEFNRSQNIFPGTSQSTPSKVVPALATSSTKVLPAHTAIPTCRSWMWESISSADIESAISDSPLGYMVNTFRSTYIPRLPLEMVILDALVLAGASMVRDNGNESVRGRKRLDLKIASIDGMATNFYAMKAAPTCSGKEVGGIPATIAIERGLMLGNSGSPEGILDALEYAPNGIVQVSEFENFLNPQRRESNSLSMLNSMWSAGSFRQPFAKNSKRPARELTFAFPSVLAYVQPETWRTMARKKLLGNGFLGRLLITWTEDEKLILNRPNSAPVSTDGIIQALDRYSALQGTVSVYPPAGVLRQQEDLRHEIADAVKREEIHSSAIRILNEYHPRLALCLACDTVLAPEYWERSFKMVLWFIQQSQKAFLSVPIGSGGGSFVDRKEAIQGEIAKSIRRVLKQGSPASWRNIRQAANWRGQARCTGDECQRARDEMLELGKLAHFVQDGKTVFLLIE